ncbi:MAG: GntR family transcriptional regulator [Anaerolineales bacterium]|nr:GntR family transcriptional regulator [Anaerolineales bacterium]
MNKKHLYQRIERSIRADILSGKIESGTRLPSMRALAEEWDCTPSTVLKAYQELASQGLVVSRAGQGTRVIGGKMPAVRQPLRKAELVHKAEAFLLQVLTEGFSSSEVEQAVRMALDRWRVIEQSRPEEMEQEIRFVGSHDLALITLANILPELSPGFKMNIAFAGSLGGLIALADKEADLAGSHLWDEETDSYNVAYVRKILPGRRTALVTIAHRRLGLILPDSNPLQLKGLEDLARENIRFINRQSGAGTRVWLDVQLQHLSIPADKIKGYRTEAATHSEVARAIAEGTADVGVGIETAAMGYDLEFLFLTRERYELILPELTWQRTPVQRLIEWLATDKAKSTIEALGGYDTTETGTVRWVN